MIPTHTLPLPEADAVVIDVAEPGWRRPCALVLGILAVVVFFALQTRLAVRLLASAALAVPCAMALTWRHEFVVEPGARRIRHRSGFFGGVTDRAAAEARGDVMVTGMHDSDGSLYQLALVEGNVETTLTHYHRRVISEERASVIAAAAGLAAFRRGYRIALVDGEPRERAVPGAVEPLPSPGASPPEGAAIRMA